MPLSLPLIIHNLKKELISLLNQYSVRTDKVFRLASGRESNFFIDCKSTLLTPRGHFTVGHIIHNIISQSHLDAQAVAGVELGGCPIASAVSTISAASYVMKLDALYVRKEAKDHGTKKLVEGRLGAGTKVVLLEDVVTSGGSSLRAIMSLQKEGYDVLGVIALVDREEGAKEAFERSGIPFQSVFTRKDLLEGICDEVLVS